MLMQANDQNLVALANNGDGEAFGQLVSRHYDRIYNVAFRILGRKSDAEDLTQDVCANLATKMQSFRGDAKFTTWLYRLTTNAALDRLRARASRAKAADGWGAFEVASRQADREQQQELEWLQTAMAQLDPDLRATVALVVSEEMTHAAAGAVLGVSEGTISWRMSKVKEALRDIAKQEEQI